MPKIELTIKDPSLVVKNEDGSMTIIADMPNPDYLCLRERFQGTKIFDPICAQGTVYFGVDFDTESFPADFSGHSNSTIEPGIYLGKSGENK